MLCGVSRVDITPPVGTPLDGYPPGAFPSLGSRISQGVHDSLYAKVLILDDGTTKIAIISADLLGVDKDFVMSIRNLIQETTDIKAENVLITATHTHCGPVGISKSLTLEMRNECPSFINVLRNEIKTKIVNAVQIASRELLDAEISVAKGYLHLCTNRISPEGPADKEIGVLHIKTRAPNEKALATLVNFSCHPTVLGADTLLFSADYPGVATRIIEETFGDGHLSMFLHGASADVSTRFVRHEQTFEECERIGTILAREALNLVTKAKIIKNPRICIASKVTKLPKVVLPNKDEMLQVIEDIERTLQKAKEEKAPYPYLKYWSDALDGARIALSRLEGKLPHSDIFAEIQAIKLGDEVLIVAIPGELSCEIGMDIKKSSNKDYTFVVTTANDYIGYIISPKTYNERTFEAFATRISPEGVEKLYDTVIKLISEVT